MSLEKKNEFLAPTKVNDLMAFKNGFLLKTGDIRETLIRLRRTLSRRRYLDRPNEASGERNLKKKTHKNKKDTKNNGNSVCSLADSIVSGNLQGIKPAGTTSPPTDRPTDRPKIYLFIGEKNQTGLRRLKIGGRTTTVRTTGERFSQQIKLARVWRDLE